MTSPDKSVRERDVNSSFKHWGLREQHRVRQSSGQALGPGFDMNNMAKDVLVCNKFASIKKN